MMKRDLPIRKMPVVKSNNSQRIICHPTPSTTCIFFFSAVPAMVVLGKNLLSKRMNARLMGSGDKTVVLAHGYGGDQSVWDQIAPHLARSFRVLVFDWRFSGTASGDAGAGGLDASELSSYECFSEELISLLEEMKLEGVIFLGHSMSGMIGCIAAVKRPDLFERLILLAASPRYLNSEDYEGGFDVAVIQELLSGIESDFHAWAGSFAAAVVGVEDPASVDKFRRSLQRMRPEVALSLAKTVFLSDHRDVLDHLRLPCTVIQPSNDAVVPTSVAHFMARKMNRRSRRKLASVEIIEADGHLLQLTSHHLLIAALDRILGCDRGMLKNKDAVDPAACAVDADF